MVFSKKFRFKIKNLLFILSFAFIFLFLPGSALAQSIFDLPGRIIAGLPAAIIGVVLQVFVLISHTGTVICGAILDWVTGPNFISWSYTQPVNNPVIKIGLDITKNFVNLGLVVALVFIAFSIALRLKEYATQKTLVRLIAIALLVNFAPVICGLIVDASNIVMNYFLSGIEKGVGSVLTGLSAFVDSIGTDLGRLFIGPITEKISILAQAVVMIVVNWSIAFAFLLLAGIFIFRYIAIWLLVILAPLAFVAWILPATRKLWTMWWSQLIQWSIIGIPMAFFLYLAMASFAELSVKFKGKMTIPGLDSATTGLLDTVFPYFIILALLGLGFIIGLSTSAMGASAAINLTKKAGKGAGKYAGKQTAGRFLATKTGKKWAGAAAETRFGIPKVKEVKGPWKKALAGAASYVTAVPRWAAHGAGKVATEYGAGQENIIEAEKKKISGKFGKDTDRAAATYSTILPTNWQKKTAMGQYLAETKGGKGLEKLSPPQLKEVTGLTAKYSPAGLRNLSKHKPELIEGEYGGEKPDEKLGKLVRDTMVPDGASKDEEGKYKDEDVKELSKAKIEETEGFQELVTELKKLYEISEEQAKDLTLIRKAASKKAIDALKPGDIDNLSRKTIEAPDFEEMTARFKPWSFINKLGSEKGMDYVGELQTHAQKHIGVEELAKTNPSFLKSAYTPGGRAFLYNWKDNEGKEIETMERMNEIIKKAKLAAPPPTPAPKPEEEPSEEKPEKGEKKGPPEPSAGL